MGIKEEWGRDADLGNRDPNDLNQHLKVTFEESIGEPDHTHSIDCVWKYSYKCFNLWKVLCYLICTTLCGIPIASCWGCTFACVAFEHIWYLTPCFRLIDIECAPLKRLWSLAIGAICDPIFLSCGKLFSAFQK